MAEALPISTGKFSVGLAVVVVILIVFTAIVTWGKMPMGDGTTELGYGQMIASGQVPYADFYLHIFPFTGYLAAAFERTPWPIHLANLFGVFNLIIHCAAVWGICHVIKLPTREKIISFAVYFGLYWLTSISFNHHPFDITMVTLMVFFLFRGVVEGGEGQQSKWLAASAVAAAATLFLTQHIGLAAMALGPVALTLDGFWNKKNNQLKLAVRYLAVEAVVVAVAVVGVALAGISPQKMFYEVFFAGYKNYGGTYGHWSIWHDGMDKVYALKNRLTGSKSDTVLDVAPAQAVINAEKIFTVQSAHSSNAFLHFFILKASRLYSIFDIVALSFVVFCAIYAVLLGVQKCKKREGLDFIFIVWFGLIITFLLASYVVYQINFSNFIHIFVLWLYLTKNATGKLNQKVRFAWLTLLAAGAGLLVVSNSALFGYEFITREYMVSKLQNERVWLAPFYYHGFVQQFNLLSAAVAKVPDMKSFDAYPRASEIFLLLGIPPQAGTPLTNFYVPGGDYQTAVDIAKKSEVVVVYEPKFYSDDLGQEHNFAMAQLQPALDTSFSPFFSSYYFKAYKKK